MKAAQLCVGLLLYFKNKIVRLARRKIFLTLFNQPYDLPKHGI